MLNEVRSTAIFGHKLQRAYKSSGETHSGFLTASCAAVLEYVLCLEGIKGLSDKEVNGLFYFLELGKTVNNFYDEHLLSSDYRKLKKDLLATSDNLDSNSYREDFYKVVKNLERNRPDPWSSEVSYSDIVSYREQTNLVYLAAACASAGVGEITDLIDTSENIPKTHEKTPEWFKGLHNGLIATQVIDDMIGWRGDISFKRPSFFTYLCPKEYMDTPPQMIPQEVIKDIFKEMNVIFDNYRDLMHQQLPHDYALAMAIRVSKFAPTIWRIPFMLKLQDFTGVHFINEKHVNE